MSNQLASQRLQPVQKLEQMKEQQAGADFAKAQELVVLEQQKLQQLLNYRDEYREMVEAEGRQGITAQRLQSYHSFLSRLGSAVDQQQGQLEQAQQQLERHKQAWTEQRGATRVMENTIERMQQKERRAQGQREQRQEDQQVNEKLSWQQQSNR